MSKQGIRKIARDVQKSTVRYSPEILTGIGIAGMITTQDYMEMLYSISSNLHTIGGMFNWSYIN